MTTKEIEVRGILDSLKPAMEADGGGIELISVWEDCVLLRFKGACLVCPSISLTMKFGVIKIFQEKLPWVKRVVNLTTNKIHFCDTENLKIN